MQRVVVLVTALSTGSGGEYGVALSMFHETPGVAIPIRLGNQGGGTQTLPRGLVGEPSIHVQDASGNVVWRAPGAGAIGAPVHVP
jgi:hypothetical protein